MKLLRRDKYMKLEDKIKNKTGVLAVAGLGYVGLPTAITFAKAGYRVIGIDIDENKIKSLSAGHSYVLDVPHEDIISLVNSGRFCPTSDYSTVAHADAVAICVPTPLRKSKDPDVSYIISAVDTIVRFAHKDMLIVLESTTYPGTTEELIKPRLESISYQVGKDIYLCFSPERIDPGSKEYNLQNTPKVIGGITPECTRLGALLYSTIVQKVVSVSSTKSAELVKLLENSFRSVNIALVNEMALMCERMGVDVWEILDAASTKPYGFMKFSPGPGIGGHCIPLDPMYLAWKAKVYDFYTRFIELASDTNGNMPYHVVRLIGDALNTHYKPIKGSKILCMGVAYKRDVNDTRESPSLEIMRLLQSKGADIHYNDPYVPLLNDIGVELKSVPITPENLRGFDCVVLCTDHTSYDYEFIARTAVLIVDTRNAFKGIKGNIIRLGVGKDAT